jgi:uncharacterized metal-binding protein YceD (DUF177 family)
MSDSLLINLMELPEEGALFEGQLFASIFDLPEDDAQAVSPLSYKLWVQRFDSELLLRGELYATFEFQCVVTLQQFKKTIFLEEASISIEIQQQSEINATESLREEILIHFPTDPRCDEGDEPMECKIDSRYLAVDKLPESSLEDSPRVQNSDPWSALDNLNNQ